MDLTLGRARPDGSPAHRVREELREMVSRNSQPKVNAHDDAQVGGDTLGQNRQTLRVIERGSAVVDRAWPDNYQQPGRPGG